MIASPENNIHMKLEHAVPIIPAVPGEHAIDGHPRFSTTADALAHYVVRWAQTPCNAATRHAALKCLLDALCAAGAALDVAGVIAMRQGATRLLGPGDIPVWFTGTGGSIGAAMMANSAAAAAHDLDDGYRRARGHPGAAVVPAVLAMLAERSDLSADDAIAAIVAGYEVSLRVAMARPAYAPSGAWSAFGVIAALGLLRRSSEQQIANALAIAAQISPALPGLAGIVGSDVKEGIPYGCLAGLASLEMAVAGSTGPTSIFDDPALFRTDVILDGLDKASATPLIEGAYFKPYGCCRHIHGALDAFLELRRAQPFATDEIAKIEVHTYRATFNLANRPSPTSLVDAQYSLPFCLAAVAVDGDQAMLPIQVSMLEDERFLQLARQVAILHDPTIEPLFPARSPARVVVRLKDHRQLTSPLVDPRGDASRPLSWLDLEDKFRKATAHTLGSTRQAQVLGALADFDAGNPAALATVLRTPGQARESSS
jgi:2-methylcitrate dehydratase PrpD